jgi:hypothetical protein
LFFKLAGRVAQLNVRQRKMTIRQTPNGTIELRLSDNPDRFQSLGESVKEKLGARWADQIDGLDQSYWDLDVGGIKLTLQLEHYLGVSVFCEDSAPHKIYWSVSRARSKLKKQSKRPQPLTPDKTLHAPSAGSNQSIVKA